MNRRNFIFAGLSAAVAAAPQPAPGFDAGFASARDAALAVRTKKISSVELTNEMWRRIDRFNPKLNAIIWPLRESSLAEAKAADAALARMQVLGPLHGVPITIKESYNIAGAPTTWGIPQARDYRAKTSAVAVERLRKSGAVILGKTNVPLLLLDQQSYNSIYGTTNNPWDLTRTPGGSTGGGAAALAAGLGFAAMGSDIGGSIRVPAHFCGVYGLKPTLNLVPQIGQVPPGVDVNYAGFNDLAVCGPLARHAADLEDALSVVAGPASFDAKAYRWTAPAPRHTRLADFRVGYVIDDPACPVSSEMMPVYEQAIHAIEKAGAKLVKGWPPGIDVRKQYDTYLFLLGAAVGNSLPPAEQERMQKIAKDDPIYALRAGMIEPHSRWAFETRARYAARAAWEKYFTDVDVFLSPVSFTPAYPHDHSDPVTARFIPTADGRRPFMDSLFWIHPATLAGHPAVSAPVGLTASGLPVGLQIAGPFLEDPTPIAFATALAAVAGGFQAPKGYA